MAQGDGQLKTYTNEAAIPSTITRSEYAKYLESDRWKKLRAHCKRLAGDFCQGDDCENLGAEAHHVSYSNLAGDFGAELGDLLWLCRTCHQKAHGLKGAK
jgi:hypothetical protein